MAKKGKDKGKKRASAPHHDRGQPVAKRRSNPNPRFQHEPSPEPAAPAPPPPQEKQPPVSLRPEKLTLLDLKAMGQCELQKAAFEAGLLAAVPQQPNSGKYLKGDLLAALTGHITTVRPGNFLLDMLSPDHGSSRERAPPAMPKSKPKVRSSAHVPPCVCHAPLTCPGPVGPLRMSCTADMPRPCWSPAYVMHR
jgi:hypothetical protein